MSEPSRRSVLVALGSTVSLGSMAGCTDKNDYASDAERDACLNTTPLEFDGDIQRISVNTNGMGNKPVWSVKVTTKPNRDLLSLDLFVNKTPHTKEVPPAPTATSTKFDLCSERSENGFGADRGCSAGASHGQYLAQLRTGKNVLDRQGFKIAKVESDWDHPEICWELQPVDVKDASGS